MNRQGSRFRLHAGTASILLVFVTLCLISFAVLSLVNANADLRLSKKIAERNTAYYEAVSEAERFLAEADTTLLHADGKTQTTEITRTWRISDIQSLRVTVADGEDSNMIVKEYLVVTDEDAMSVIEDDTLNLPH